jgi:hypothetical protein
VSVIIDGEIVSGINGAHCALAFQLPHLTRVQTQLIKARMPQTRHRAEK